jgi:hypothetical protein
MRRGMTGASSAKWQTLRISRMTNKVARGPGEWGIRFSKSRSEASRLAACRKMTCGPLDAGESALGGAAQLPIGSPEFIRKLNPRSVRIYPNPGDQARSPHQNFSTIVRKFRPIARCHGQAAGAQKRDRTALRMSQNCENLDLGCFREGPVGAPRMYFYQRIWVPSPKKPNDFNDHSIQQIDGKNRPFCPHRVTEFRSYPRAFAHSSQ